MSEKELIKELFQELVDKIDLLENKINQLEQALVDTQILQECNVCYQTKSHHDIKERKCNKIMSYGSYCREGKVICCHDCYEMQNYICNHKRYIC